MRAIEERETAAEASSRMSNDGRTKEILATWEQQVANPTAEQTALPNRTQKFPTPPSIVAVRATMSQLMPLPPKKNKKM